MDGSGSLMAWLCGFELAPQFNQPYLSTSLSDFWGRRWNIVASSCLRFLIYEPIAECESDLNLSSSLHYLAAVSAGIAHG